jgi:hypothetical protein
MSLKQYDVVYQFEWPEEPPQPPPGGGGGAPTPTAAGPPIPPGSIAIPGGYVIYVPELDSYAVYTFETNLLNPSGPPEAKHTGWKTPAEVDEAKTPKGAISEKELRDKGANFDQPGIAILNGQAYKKNPDGTYTHSGKADPPPGMTAAQFQLGLAQAQNPGAPGAPQGQGTGLPGGTTVGGLQGPFALGGGQFANNLAVTAGPTMGSVSLTGQGSSVNPQFSGQLNDTTGIGHGFDAIAMWAGATGQSVIPPQGVGYGTPQHMAALGMPSPTGQPGNATPAGLAIQTERTQASVEHPNWTPNQIQANIFDILIEQVKRQAQANAAVNQQVQTPSEVAGFAEGGIWDTGGNPTAIVDLKTGRMGVASENGLPERITINKSMPASIVAAGLGGR